MEEFLALVNTELNTNKNVENVKDLLEVMVFTDVNNLSFQVVSMLVKAKLGFLDDEEMSYFTQISKMRVDKLRNSYSNLLKFQSIPKYKHFAKILMHRTWKDIIKACEETIALIHFVCESDDSISHKVTFLTTVGDFYRYICECSEDEYTYDKLYLEAKNMAEEFYKKAEEKAEMLATNDYRRLGFVLNYSVFIDKILKDRYKAYTTTKKAIDNCMQQTEQDKLQTKEDEVYSDAQNLRDQIMQNLTQNALLWKIDFEHDDEESQLEI